MTLYPILLIFFNILFISFKSITCIYLTPLYLRLRRKKIDSENGMRKFGKSFYRLMFYLISIILEILVLLNEKWVFKSKLYSKPLAVIPLKIRLFYIFQISFYLAEFGSIFFEIQQKDFIRISFHHVVSILLLVISFNNNLIKYGLLILLLHNLSDPLLELSKQEYYLMKFRNSNIIFFIFMISFIGLRLLIYPRWLMVSAIKYMMDLPSANLANILGLGLLLLLQVIHLSWSRNIIKIFIKIINSEDSIENKIKKKKLNKNRRIKKIIKQK